LEPGNEGPGPDEPLAEASLALAGIVGASVQGRVALGARAGARVRRLGDGRPRHRERVKAGRRILTRFHSPCL
jgi:hypothetical protein